MERPSLLPDDDPFRRLERDDAQGTSQEVAIADDPEVIRQWAAQHDAEPATGEATPSRPATINVQDTSNRIPSSAPARATRLTPRRESPGSRAPRHHGPSPPRPPGSA